MSPATGTRARLAWLGWAVFTVAWTIALTSPIDTPLPSAGGVAFWLEVKFYIAKTLHVCVYAAWAAATGWLRPAPRWRLVLLFFLLTHGVATEQIQTFVPDRTGSLRDALLDHLGIALGVAAAWRWWTEPPHES